MSARIIGVAVDGSSTSENALKWAADHIYRTGDTIVILHVYAEHVHATPGISDPVAISKAYSKEHEKIESMLYRHSHFITSQGKKCHSVTAKIQGKIADSLLKLGDDNGVDMIVTGTRGLGAVKRAFLGSVSDYLIKNCKVPVIVFRDKDASN